MESEIWIPAAFSPALGGGKKLGNIYEMRIYTYAPGAMPKVLEAWENRCPSASSSPRLPGVCLVTSVG